MSPPLPYLLRVRPWGICPTTCRSPFFEALLETFAPETGADVGHIILLVLDNARWHSVAGSTIPQGILPVDLSTGARELPPAATLWTRVDETSVNEHVPTIALLEQRMACRPIALADAPEQIKIRADFRRRPKRFIPSKSAWNSITDRR